MVFDLFEQAQDIKEARKVESEIEKLHQEGGRDRQERILHPDDTPEVDNQGSTWDSTTRTHRFLKRQFRVSPGAVFIY